MNTRSQKQAQKAFDCITRHSQKSGGKPDKEFTSTAKKFPSLIHTCGLAQAVVFAKAKDDNEYLGYLAEVLKEAGHGSLTDANKLNEGACKSSLNDYLRLSRDAILAAGWLKRYVEAAGGED